jgi:hypothetical protein
LTIPDGVPGDIHDEENKESPTEKNSGRNQFQGDFQIKKEDYDEEDVSCQEKQRQIYNGSPFPLEGEGGQHIIRYLFGAGQRKGEKYDPDQYEKYGEGPNNRSTDNHVYSIYGPVLTEPSQRQPAARASLLSVTENSEKRGTAKTVPRNLHQG